MPRPPRLDRPGALYHVTNRGHAHRPLFETDADARTFLAPLASLARAREIAILVYCILSTHFHLIVRSLRGKLDDAMQWAQSHYATYFNRTRERDGHAFKSRYFARLIQDDIYLANAVVYVDSNPSDAGMVPRGERYHLSSARYYAGERPPLWLAPETVQRLICRITRTSVYRPDQYHLLAEFVGRESAGALVSAALSRPCTPLAPLQILVQAGPTHVQQWLRRATLAEEGREVPCLVVPGSTVLDLLTPRTDDPQRDLVARELLPLDLRQLQVGLLHVAAGWTTRQIAARLSCTQGSICRALEQHRLRMAHDPDYAARAGRALSVALRSAYGRLAPLAEPHM